MELIVISNPTPVTDEPMLINNLFMAGLKYFHIRKPESDIQSVKRLLNGIAPRFYEMIALHQYHEIAADYGIKRLHYTETMRKASSSEKWQSQLDDGFTLSTSIHDVSLLRDFKSFDYVFYGPVFDSISKPCYQSKLAADFKLDKTNMKPKVIALGGVEISNLTKLQTMGFDGVAVLGTLWTEPNKAVDRYIKLKATLPVLT